MNRVPPVYPLLFPPVYLAETICLWCTCTPLCTPNIPAETNCLWSAWVPAAGVDVSTVPQSELDAGSGPILDAESRWVKNLANCRNNGREARAAALLTLLYRIDSWRDDVANRLGMAPASVLPSHLAKAVAYAMPTSVEGLQGAGVRITGVEDLAALIASSVAELGLSAAGTGTETGDGHGRAMSLGLVTPAASWKYAVYKPKIKKGCAPEPPVWEQSWARFQQGGEAIEAIAMTPAGGRVIQPATVAGHVMEALTHGKPVDLGRLYSGQGAVDAVPRETEWERLEDAAAAAAMDPQGDPANFAQRDVLKALLGDAAVDKDRELKSEAERGLESAWYNKIRTWVALRRSGYQPRWVEDGDEPGAKKPRMG